MATGVDLRSTTKTRVQRRVEKKQAVLLVVLVLLIAVTSFVLGLIVGRHTAEPEIVQQVLEPRRIAVADDPAPATPAAPTPAEPVDEKLTFYDNLSKDEPAPIGSGINLPPDGAAVVPTPKNTPSSEAPAAEVQATEVVAAVKAEAAPAQAPAAVIPPPKKAAEKVAVKPAAASTLPAAVKGGNWVVQVFASKSAADAGTLRDKLNGKGYPAFITEADLGKKGIWYRVHLGPFADKTSAVQAQAYAEKKDHLKGFAKRR